MPTMRLLSISPDVRQAADRLREHAEKPENWFRPGPPETWGRLQGSGLRPGDKPEHHLQIPFGFSCVFSWTIASFGGKPTVVRDLSVKVPDAIPNPIAVYEIAELFGFTKREKPGSPGGSWLLHLDSCKTPCVCVIEAVEGADPERTP